MEENALSVSEVKGTPEDFADLFGINKIVARKVRKGLYALRLQTGVNNTINTSEHRSHNRNLSQQNNQSIINNRQFCVNVRGKQARHVTLKRMFTASSLVSSVAQAYKDEECVEQHYKVEKIIMQSGGRVLLHNKQLSYYNIVSENNLISIIFKTKGGAEAKYENEDREIKFQRYGLTQSSLPDCLIGYDDEDGIPRALLDCGKHAMAADTMYSYVTSTLASNERQKDIFCPIKGCGKKISWQKCTQIADMNRHEYLKWTDILEKHRMANMKECPHCKAYCKRDEGVAIFRMRCIACNGSDWCWNCCQPWRGSGLAMCANQNCSIIRETNNRLQNCGKIMSTYKYEVPKFRACPRCLTFIEYSQACKHMICSGCDKQFCFLCLGLQKADGGWDCGSHANACKLAPTQRF